MMHNDSEKISASEINKYLYCHNQWYYERYYGAKCLRQKRKELNISYNGDKENNFERGKRFHDNYMRVDILRRLIKVIIMFVVAAIIVFMYFKGIS